MTKLQKKITSAIATSAVLLQLVAPAALASTSLEISGNGDSTDNTIQFTNNSSTVVTQSNTANVTNVVNANSDTGNNNASRNTGGDILIDTGDSTTVATVENNLNSNVADVNSCDCGEDTDVLISGNGVDSDNDVDLKKNNNTQVFQDNYARVLNKVDADSNTGDNRARRNTGGDIDIITGNSAVGVAVSTTANSNYATVGRRGGFGGSGSVSAWIVDNGDSSDNDLKLTLKKNVTLTQDNSARVSNYVDADSTTGWNRANRNTGGNITVDTGDSDVIATVENNLNFNSADVGCDCMLGDIWAKVAGNGVESDNDIKANLDSDLQVFQDNVCGKGGWRVLQTLGRRRPHRGGGCDTYLNANGLTGDNNVNRNTGDTAGDPAIYTGDSYVDTGVWNNANSNVFGSAPDNGGYDWPGVSGMGLNLNISFDIDDLLAALMGA